MHADDLDSDDLNSGDDEVKISAFNPPSLLRFLNVVSSTVLLPVLLSFVPTPELQRAIMRPSGTVSRNNPVDDQEENARDWRMHPDNSSTTTVEIPFGKVAAHGTPLTIMHSGCGLDDGSGKKHDEGG